MGQVTTNLGLPGPGGGVGSVRVSIRSDNDQLAVFSTFADLETYTDTSSGTEDANRINVTSANLAQEAFVVGTITNNAFVGDVTPYVRVNDDWVLSIAPLVGLPGTDGTNGIDGTVLEFGSESERDTFFSTRLDMLRTNLPIMVTVAVETVSAQVWTGGTNPSSYNAIFWRVASIRSGTASFELDEIHTFSSGGQQVFVSNEATQLAFFTAQQFVGDHTNPARRIASNSLMSRQYAGDLTQAPPPTELGGPAATTGSIPFDVTFDIQGASTSLNGLMYIPTEDYTGRLEYSIIELDSGNNIVEFTQTLDVVLLDTVPFTQWFRIPSEIILGSNARARLIKSDGTILNVRPEAGNLTRPYSTTYLRLFADVPVLISTQAAGQLDPVILTGNNLNKVVDETANTITLSVGGGPPASEPVITSLSIQGQSNSVDPETEISGSNLFNFAVMRPAQVTGTLTLTQDGAQIATGISPTATTTTVTVTTITLSAGDSTTFVLSGASNTGQAFSRSLVIRAAELHEFAYYGIRSTDDFATVAISELTSFDFTALDNFEVTGAWAAGSFVGILTPENLDADRIEVLGANVINTFTETENVRVIGGQQYALRTRQNSGSLETNAAFTVRRNS